MKIAKYTFLILIILLTTGISSMVFYDAAIRVKDKKILVINFADSTEVDVNLTGVDEDYNLDIFELKEFTHKTTAPFTVQIENEDISFDDFDLKHEKIMITVSDIEFCYVQSELHKSGKFETLKELSSDNNIVRVDDKDYHVKTLVDLSQGKNYNFQYILPVECNLTVDEKLEQINQYVNYDPEEQRKLLQEELKQIQESKDIQDLKNRL